jgi:hypothetical protein
VREGRKRERKSRREREIVIERDGQGYREIYKERDIEIDS